MASNEEHFLNADQNQSFRELLIQLINNLEISSLLVSETLDISSTCAILLANMVVLTQSPRNIVLIFEHLNKKDNSALSKALEKKQTKFSNPLKKIETLKTGNPEIFVVVLAVNHHVTVLGAENKKCNPFGEYKDHEMDASIIKQMQKFQKSPERITVTNEVFHHVVLKYCNSYTLSIFIGGVAHPIALPLETQQYDPGLQGPIKDRVSIYLVESSAPSIARRAAYTEEDGGVQGTSDCEVMTDKNTIYLEAFGSVPELINKIELLNNILNALKGHLLFKKSSNFVIDEKLQAILPAFQKSAGIAIKFDNSEAYIAKQQQEKEQRHSSKHSFFSLKTTEPILRDSKISVLISVINIFIVSVLLVYKFTFSGIIDGLFIVNQNLIQEPFWLLDAAGSLFTIIFWATSTSYKMEIAVILCWLALLFSVLLIGNVHLAEGSKNVMEQIILGTLTIPCILALLLRVFAGANRSSSALYESRLKWLLLSTILFLIPVYPALMLSKALYVKTFDISSLHFDALLSATLIPNLRTIIDSIPGAPTVLFYAYGFTPVGFLATALLQLSGRPSHVASALLVWVTASTFAVIAYNFFPITGPMYVFDDINSAFLNASSYPLGMASPQNGARNGMPSMHFGWMFAASILWWQAGSSTYSRAVMILQTILVLMATLYFGEHYVMDLILAAPFMLSIIALCTTNIPLHYAPRKYCTLTGFLVWFTWVILLRTQLEFFIINPWIAKLLIAITFILTACQFYLLSKFTNVPSNVLINDRRVQQA